MFSTNKNRKNVVGKKSFAVAFRPLSLSLLLLFVSTCVHPGERSESSMSNTSRAAFLQARQCWPDRGQDERILAPAKQIYEAWQGLGSNGGPRRRARDRGRDFGGACPGPG